MQPLSKQRLSKQISAYRTVLCNAVTSSTQTVFSMVPVQNAYKRSEFRAVAGQLLVGHSHGKFEVKKNKKSASEGLTCDFKTFMCAVMQYLECDSYSSCVKIRCQETETLQRNSHCLDLLPSNV
jgi:hypothetical protein